MLSRGDKKEADLHTMLLAYSTTIASSAGGQISSFFVNNISACGDWSGFVNSFGEYRVLGVRMEYMPNNRYSKSTTITTPAIGAVRHNSSTSTPASYTEVMEYASARKLSLEDPWVMEAFMTGTEEAQFLTTSDTAPRYGIILYADGLTSNTTYGRYFFYWRVQFRGRV